MVLEKPHAVIKQPVIAETDGSRCYIRSRYRYICLSDHRFFL